MDSNTTTGLDGPHLMTLRDPVFKAAFTRMSFRRQSRMIAVLSNEILALLLCLRSLWWKVKEQFNLIYSDDLSRV